MVAQRAGVAEECSSRSLAGHPFTLGNPRATWPAVVARLWRLHEISGDTCLHCCAAVPAWQFSLELPALPRSVVIVRIQSEPRHRLLQRLPLCDAAEAADLGSCGLPLGRRRRRSAEGQPRSRQQPAARPDAAALSCGRASCRRPRARCAAACLPAAALRSGCAGLPAGSLAVPPASCRWRRRSPCRTVRWRWRRRRMVIRRWRRRSCRS